MKILFLLFFIGINVHGIQLSCANVNESVTEKITDLLKDSYSKVEFYNLSIASMGTKLPTNCDYVSFDFPKKVDLSGDLIIKFDSFLNGKFQKGQHRFFALMGMPLFTNLQRLFIEEIWLI